MRTKLKPLPYGISAGIGGFVGTVLYSMFVSDAAEIDWARAMFVGAFTVLVAALWPREKK